MCNCYVKLSLYNLIFILSLVSFIYLINSKHKDDNKCKIIAHGCGEIDTIPYTNALEAFYNSYNSGFKNIEIDLLVTVDNHVVGAHDWDKFKTLTNYSEKDIINYTYIVKSKILNKYHIIYDAMIFYLLNKYKDITIFIDKITNYFLLKKYSKILNRLYVEVFTYQQYYESKKLGFTNIMLNINTDKELKKFILSNSNITAITIGPYIFSKKKKELLYLYKSNIDIFAFLVKNVSDMKAALCKYITGFYVDKKIV